MELGTYRSADKKRILTVEYDEHAEDPRKWAEYDSTMACVSRDLNIGDQHDYDVDALNEIQASDKYVALPIYKYEHSGVTINTTGFSCRFDSGQIGVIFISKEDIRKHNKVKRVTEKLVNEYKAKMVAEVAEYALYLEGESYSYNVEEVGGDGDEPWHSYLGDMDGLKKAIEGEYDWDFDTHVQGKQSYIWVFD